MRRSSETRISERHERLSPVECGACPGRYTLGVDGKGRYGLCDVSNAAGDLPERYKRLSDALNALDYQNGMDADLAAFVASTWTPERGF